MVLAGDRFRTAVIYAYTLILLRWLGSRTIGQFSNLEFLLVIALGSAVGDAMFYADVPLLHTLLVITLVVLANKGLDLLMARRSGVEKALDGVPKEAVKQGVIAVSFFENGSMSERELFQQLRHEGIEHLGEVEHAYIETDGKLTVFKSKDGSRPGLPIVPPWEIEALIIVDPLDNARGVDLVCTKCGYRRSKSDRSGGPCKHCQHRQWTFARY